MRKILSILIVLVLMASISSIVLADDNGHHYGTDNEFEDEDDDQNDTDDDINETDEPEDNETEEPEDNETEDDVDEETEKEIKMMNDSLGAEIRLLQLQKALLKNILKGEMAVEVLIGLDFNTTELESILDEMKALLEEVKIANTTSNDSVQIFVSLKNESKNLTTQFRETIRELLGEVTLQEIRQRIREMYNESGELENCSKLVRHLIRQFNYNQMYRLYGLVGLANSSYANEYLNGTLPLNETKLQLCKLINQLTKEKKYEIFTEIKGENSKKEIHAQEEIEQMGDHGNGKGNGNGKN